MFRRPRLASCTRHVSRPVQSRHYRLLGSSDTKPRECISGRRLGDRTCCGDAGSAAVVSRLWRRCTRSVCLEVSEVTVRVACSFEVACFVTGCSAWAGPLVYGVFVIGLAVWRCLSEAWRRVAVRGTVLSISGGSARWLYVQSGSCLVGRCHRRRACWRVWSGNESIHESLYEDVESASSELFSVPGSFLGAVATVAS